MGALVDGQWLQTGFPTDESGRFVRAPTTIRGRISSDGSTEFPAESGRYHLYVAWACPWAHRTMIVRALLGLDDAITVSVVDPFMGDDGWAFTGSPGSTLDELNSTKLLREIYLLSDPKFTGRVTVPVLWDKTAKTIVNNESREIIRMFGEHMRGVSGADIDLCPDALRAEIDETIDAFYEPVNNGVYRSGFAKSQEAYEGAVTTLFEALDRWDEHLSTRRYLCGAQLTEADVCLFTTLVRFDLVYHGHFKCNVRRIQDYRHLWGFVRDVYQTRGVAATCHFDHIKRHYYQSHESVNPTRIYPKGPLIDFAAPHERARLG